MCAVVAALSFGVPAGAQADVANPPWPARCPLRLGLVVDRSSSMDGRFGEVREAAANVVDALRDKPSEVTIIGFGTAAEVVRSAVDVSDEETRHQLKDQINDFGTLGGDDSATNWEAALSTAGKSSLDVVILITDGLPNAYGDPAVEGPEAVDAAVDAADRLKEGSTRLAAVGIDLDQEGERNLQAITGPVPGEDYYVTDTAGLLRQLYSIVASSCGVAIAQLPQPEPPVFPWLQTIVGTLACLLLIGLAAALLHRRRAGSGPRPATGPSRSAVAGSAIDYGHLAQRLRDEKPAPPTTKDSP